MKFHLSTIIVFSLLATLICEQTLLATATEEERGENHKKDAPPISFLASHAQKDLESYKIEKAIRGGCATFKEDYFSGGVDTLTESPSKPETLSVVVEEDEEFSHEGHDFSKSKSSLSVIAPRRDVSQEVNALIQSIGSLSLVDRSLKEDEKIQGVWNRFPRTQIGDLQQAISRRTHQCIDSITMFVSNGLAKFLVIDAIPAATVGLGSEISLNYFFDNFFDLKDGEEIFTSPINMFGDERSYAFSKDSTEAKKISFKLVLKRLHLENEEFSKLSVFHPLETKLQIFEPYSGMRKECDFCLTSVHTSGFKGSKGTLGVSDNDSIRDLDFSIAYVEAHDGFVNVVYACPEPEVDLDDTSLNIYDPETKAFRYFHVKLQPQT